MFDSWAHLKIYARYVQADFSARNITPRENITMRAVSLLLAGLIVVAAAFVFVLRSFGSFGCGRPQTTKQDLSLLREWSTSGIWVGISVPMVAR